MKATVTWVLIADGAQAQVYENRGPGKGLAPVDGLSFEEEPLQAKDIMSDRKGRSFSSAGAGRSAMEYSTDPVQVREARFVKSVADHLDARLKDGAFDRLIVAAAPNALGDIRAALTDNLKKSIMAELPKDLTNIPRNKLDRHLDGLLAV